MWSIVVTFGVKMTFNGVNKTSTFAPPFGKRQLLAVRKPHPSDGRCIMVSKYRSTIHPKRDVLPDGTEVRLVPLERTKNRPLYVTSDGRVFSHVRGYRPLATMADTSKTNKYNGHRKQKYRKMNNTFAYILIHHAVALTWIGPQPTYISPRTGKETKCVIDHLNGVTTDNRVENLEWITREENDRRARYLRVLRETDHDPRIFTPAQLRSFFAIPFNDFKDVACSLFDSKKKQAV